jgi:hypothetical protein
MASRYTKPSAYTQFKATELKDMMVLPMAYHDRYEKSQKDYLENLDKFSSKETRFVEKDIQKKNSLIEGLQGRVKEISEKYNGDFARARNEIAREISSTRNNEFWQLNEQAVVRAKELQKQIDQMKLTNPRGLLTFDDSALTQSLYDDEGNPRQLGFDVQARADDYGIAKEVMGRIATDAQALGLSRAEVDGYLKYGITKGISQQKVDALAKIKTDAYKQANPQFEKRLTELEGVQDQNVVNQEIDKLLRAAASEQVGRETQNTYIFNQMAAEKRKAAREQQDLPEPRVETETSSESLRSFSNNTVEIAKEKVKSLNNAHKGDVGFWKNLSAGTKFALGFMFKDKGGDKLMKSATDDFVKEVTSNKALLDDFKRNNNLTDVKNSEVSNLLDQTLGNSSKFLPRSLSTTHKQYDGFLELGQNKFSNLSSSGVIYSIDKDGSWVPIEDSKTLKNLSQNYNGLEGKDKKINYKVTGYDIASPFGSPGFRANINGKEYFIPDNDDRRTAVFGDFNKLYSAILNDRFVIQEKENPVTFNSEQYFKVQGISFPYYIKYGIDSDNKEFNDQIYLGHPSDGNEISLDEYFERITSAENLNQFKIPTTKQGVELP